MQPKLQVEDEITAGMEMDLTAPPFVLAMPDPAERLQPAVARGIAGSTAGAVDLLLLSITLICFALGASGNATADHMFQLLSMKITVGHFVVLALCWIAWRLCYSYCGLYTWQHVQTAKGVLGRVIAASGLSALIGGEVIAYVWHDGHSARFILSFWMVAACSTLMGRAALGVFHMYVRPHLRRCRNAVIVGSGARGAAVREELRTHPEWDYNFLGFVDSNPRDVLGTAEGLLGRINDLESILMQQVVDEVIIAVPAKTQYAAIERVISICERVGVQVQYWEELFEKSQRIHWHREKHDHRRIVLKMVHDDYRQRIKRAIDIGGALFGLVVGAPLFLVVAILIKITSKGPVLFRQERYGLGKRTFRIVKFRTMVENAEAAQATLEHMNQNSGPVFKIFKDPRVTKVGAFLRKTSIDELPQLINVLKGEMSLVGPRPLNKRDVSRFSAAWLMRRFSVKPGLTCLWQISGRSNVSFDRWIALDLHYIDHWSLQMDLKILALTLPAVIKGTGAA
jgi:exopolysaccharide biosynthesis polyprenyl glycosylphosphotransferase